jgi:hypothetical protein
VTWWAWTGLWILLVTGSLVVFFLIGRSLWRKVKALIDELRVAADRLSAVSAELGTITGAGSQEEQEGPAVFTNPTVLRQQRYLAARETARKPRRQG